MFASSGTCRFRSSICLCLALSYSIFYPHTVYLSHEANFFETTLLSPASTWYTDCDTRRPTLPGGTGKQQANKDLLERRDEDVAAVAAASSSSSPSPSPTNAQTSRSHHVGLARSRSRPTQYHQPRRPPHRTHPTDRNSHPAFRPHSPETHDQKPLLPTPLAAPRLHQNRLRLRKASNPTLRRRALRCFGWKAEMHPLRRADALGFLLRPGGAGVQVASRLVRTYSDCERVAEGVFRGCRGEGEAGEDALWAL